MLCFWAAMYVYVPVFPVYTEMLGAPLNIVGLAVGAYGLTQMLTRIPVGIWSDAIGKRRIFVSGGMMVCSVSAVGLALAPDPFWLVVFRGVMGLAAATWVCSTVLFVSYFPANESAVPLSIMAFASAVGQVLGTAAGGVLADMWGWTAPFWVSLVLGVLAAIIVLWVPDEITSDAATPRIEGLWHIVKSPLLVLACGIGFIVYFATTSTVYGFTPILAERLGATRTELGILTTGALLSYSFLTVLTPRFVHRLGERPTLLTGFAIITFAILPIPLANDTGGLLILQMVGGIGRGLVTPLLMGLAIRSVAVRDRASAMGIFQAAYAFGMFIGPWLSGNIADTLGLAAVFIVCGGLCLIGLLATLLVMPRIELRSAFEPAATLRSEKA